MQGLQEPDQPNRQAVPILRSANVLGLVRSGDEFRIRRPASDTARIYLATYAEVVPGWQQHVSAGAVRVAMKTCPDCEQAVSERADDCPHCGRLMGDGWIQRIVRLIIFGTILGQVLSIF